MKNHTHAGVGIVIKNELNNYLEDVDPINDRLISMTFQSKKPISIIATYAFTSNGTEEEKNTSTPN